MVRKYEESITDATPGATSSSERTNGTATYADSLKLHLKQQPPADRPESYSNPYSNHDNEDSNDCNGLLSELVVNVASNVVQPISRPPFTASNHHTSNSISSSIPSNNITSNSITSNSINSNSITSNPSNNSIIKPKVNMPNQVLHQFAGPVNSGTKPEAKKPASIASSIAPSIAPSKVSHSTQPTISTLSTKQMPKSKEPEPMTVDCVKRKIRTQIIEADGRSEHIEVLFFINGIEKDTLNVSIQEKSLVFKFRTADSGFLRLHNISLKQFMATFTTHRITNGTINGASTEENQFSVLNCKPELDKSKLPVFVYTVETLFDKVLPAECSYELTDHHLKICLKKKIAIKWNELEHVKSEMCVNYLKNVATPQMAEASFKYKPPNKSPNFNKLLSAYEKPAEKSPPPPRIDEEDPNNNGDTKEADAIPIPPPLPSTCQPLKYSPVYNGEGYRRPSRDRKEEVNERMFNDLMISPVKPDDDHQDTYQKFRRPTPLSFQDDDDEMEARKSLMQPPSMRLNLAEAKGQIGYTGLSNLGNTCYMNSCLQCLSNTVELRDYFLSEQYKDDLNKENPFGSNGHLAEAFGEVLYKLWVGNSSYFSPARFKRLIDENCSQFIGYSQHDSVEFMEHFLDVLHEDLNRVDRKNVKPASPIENEDELSDEQLANEQWLRHKQRNDSIITNLFYGQYKSKLVCPKCSKVSITFDPFLYLPIPLTKNKIVYNLYLFRLDGEQPPERMSVKLPQGSKFLNLLEIVCSRTGLERFGLVPCQINQSGELEQEFRISNYIPDQLAKLKKLYIYQRSDDRSLNKFIVHQTIPKAAAPEGGTRNFKGKCEYCNKWLSKPGLEPVNCEKCNRVAYCNEKCKNEDYVLHFGKCKNEPMIVGWPAMFFEDVETATYDDVMRKLEAIALRSVDVVESELKEEKPVEDADVHLGEEVREGQELDDPQESANNEPLTNEDEKPQVEAMECEDGPSQEPTSTSSSQEEKSADSPMADASLTTEEAGSFDKEKQEEEVQRKTTERKERDSGFRFVLKGKMEELNASKCSIYIPKEDSELEQKRFRQSLRQYYYLFVDWKESYSRVDEDGQRRSYSLDVQSKELNKIATGSVVSNFEQEKTECTLQDLMTKFTEPETLSTQEAWVCPTCKEPRTASKELTIWRPPQILVIQLKRFSYSTYSREKIDKFVNYPIKGLDISKFCSDPKLLDQTQPIYDLYAVIDHFGGLYGGHYTANANSSVNNKDLGWRAFNDSSVRDIDEDAAVSRSAYVLFYRLRNSGTGGDSNSGNGLSNNGISNNSGINENGSSNEINNNAD